MLRRHFGRSWKLMLELGLHNVFLAKGVIFMRFQNTTISAGALSTYLKGYAAWCKITDATYHIVTSTFKGQLAHNLVL